MSHHGSHDDRQLRNDVIDALDRELADFAKIGVTAENGVVTLTGQVSGLDEKWILERAVWRVPGVRAIAQEVVVREEDTAADSDDRIAGRVADMLSWNPALPPGAIRVTVQDGRATLTGEVSASHQRAAAEDDALRLAGVREVINLIEIQPAIRPGELRHRIQEALRRHAELQASMIAIDIHDDGAVTLMGSVDSADERVAIEQAMWSAPGVRRIDDRIAVR